MGLKREYLGPRTGDPLSKHLLCNHEGPESESPNTKTMTVCNPRLDRAETGRSLEPANFIANDLPTQQETRSQDGKAASTSVHGYPNIHVHAFYKGKDF